MPRTRLPVILLTGFLGSGKTLLLNALLRSPRYANTAVIVNEFGEIGLDHFLVQSSVDNVVLLEAGCLCCTIADSLHETLADLHFRRTRGEVPPFERVIIETTGLADPAPIVNTLLGNKLVSENFELAAVVTTVDAMHALAGMERQREVAKQIAVADRLVITKGDLCASQLVARVKRRLAQINPAADVFESRQGDAALAALSTENLLRAHGIAAYDAPWTTHDHDRHDEQIRAHCFVLDSAVSWSGYAAWTRLMVDLLGDRLLRCKGLLEISDSGAVVFVQGVQRVFHAPERLPGWPDADRRSRLVCITRDVTGDEIRRILPALELPAGSDPNITLAELTTATAP